MDRIPAGSRATRVASLIARLARVTALAIAGAASAPATAAACAGFNDVDGASAFCADVQWIRNRAVTQGCGATTYCPNDSVTRLQMAVFMSRLGKVLQPTFLSRTEYASGINNSGTVLCQLDAPVAAYARVATSSSVMLAFNSGSAASMFVHLVTSADQGANWSPWSQISGALALPSASQGTISPAAPPIAVPAGQAMRFGIRASASMIADFYDLECEFTVRLDSAADAAP